MQLTKSTRKQVLYKHGGYHVPLSVPWTPYPHTFKVYPPPSPRTRPYLPMTPPTHPSPRAPSTSALRHHPVSLHPQVPDACIFLYREGAA